MNKLFATRNNQIMLFFIVLAVILIIRLFSLTIVQGEELLNASRNNNVKNVYTLAPRGEIRDRYGRLLAGNKPRFIVQLVIDEMEADMINPTIERLIRVFEQNGDTYVDNFPILIHDGIFEFTYQAEIREWLISQEMPPTFTAGQAFDELRRRHNISEDLDQYDAQEELQTVYNTYPPISVRKMVFTKANEQTAFLEKYKLDTNMSAKEAFYAIAKNFQIETDQSPEAIRKLLIIRDSLKSQGYLKYLPVKIATDISEATIVNIEEYGNEFRGVEVVAEPVRYYPYGDAAAHVIGYLGQISEGEKAEYEEKGYKGNSMIGKEGIERAFEAALKGTDGVKKMEVNASGNMQRVISETDSRKGDDVYLTIDIELQKSVQASLEKGLAEIRRGGVYTSPWGNYHYARTYQNANAGAVVVLDVKSSDVLAMASYPSFDPNLFATGIKTADWNALQTKNPRDPLAPVPLYNTATRTPVQPGSIFKMVTATAAMDKGLDPNQKLYDGGAVWIGEQSFGCSIWNSRRGSHGSINLVQALERSCNYYFYDAGFGKDWYRSRRLTNEPITIETMMEYAKMYGLGLKTGIEIPESAPPVPSRERNLENAKANLKYHLEQRANDRFEAYVRNNPELLEKTIAEIVSWLDQDPEPTRGKVRQQLLELGVMNITTGKAEDNPLENLTDTIKYGYFRSAKWIDADQLNISIGQGQNQYTPLQMANYIATIANGGTLNKVSVIKGIQNQPDREKTDGTVLPIKDLDQLKYLREGMYKVTSGSSGTARGSFGNFPIKVAAKTGTAEVDGKIQPPDEVEYIRSNLRRINARLTFEQVEAEMARIMVESPELSKNTAVRLAVVNLTQAMSPKRTAKSITAQIDANKPGYDNFSWFVCFAPYDDPEIAIAILLIQGGSGGYAAPIARDIIAEYMGMSSEYPQYNVQNTMTE